MSAAASLDSTMGAAFIGVVIAAVLHGVSLVQGWYYFTHQQDPFHIVALVVAVMVFDTVHQALISHTVYTYLVTNYNNPPVLLDLVWSLLVEVLFNGLTALLVQTFLGLRVWRLSNHNVILTGIIGFLVCAEFGCVIAYGAVSLQLHTFAELANLKSLSVTVNALAAAGDVLIAITLCALLHKSRTGFSRSDTIINKLILFAVNTGVLTSLCAIASLISILCAPGTFIYITFFFCIGRLYTNSLLATLNARKMIRHAAEVESSGGHTVSLKDFSNTTGPIKSKGSVLSFTSRRTPFSGLSSSNRPPATSIAIKIDTTKERTVDGADGEKPSSPSSLSPTTTMGSPIFATKGGSNRTLNEIKERRREEIEMDSESEGTLTPASIRPALTIDAVGLRGMRERDVDRERDLEAEFSGSPMAPQSLARVAPFSTHEKSSSSHSFLNERDGDERNCIRQKGSFGMIKGERPGDESPV